MSWHFGIVSSLAAVSRSLESGRERLHRAGPRGHGRPGSPAALQQLAWQALESLRQQQASAFAYFDCFWIFAVVTLALVLVVPLMKRSVAEKGAHVGGE
jgi:DHA2 family multidrug resistance protein